MPCPWASILTLATAGTMPPGVVPASRAALVPHRVTVRCDDTAADPRRIEVRAPGADGADGARAASWMPAGATEFVFEAVCLPSGAVDVTATLETDVGALLPAAHVVTVPIADPPATVVPVPGVETRGLAAGWGAGRTWVDQHEDILGYGRRHDAIDVVLLGDSITQSWGGAGRSVAARGEDARRRHLGDWRLANMGISGDRTQHVLWRLADGSLDDLSPAIVTILIGTNNLSAGDAPEAVALGIRSIVERVTAVAPHARVVLMPILPRGAPDDPLRDEVDRVNELVAELARRPDVVLLDLGPRLLDSDGTLRRDLYAPDGLHLAPAGYDMWGAALAACLREE